MNKACYVKCNAELDCGNGFSCNTTTKLCTQNGACTTDADCAKTSNDVGEKCSAGICMTPCKVDLDCSPSGSLVNVNYRSPFNGKVCGQDSFCHNPGFGCTSDADCADTANRSANPNAPHALCVTPAAPANNPLIHSAIIN